MASKVSNKEYHDDYYTACVKRQRFEGAGLEKEFMEKYYKPKQHIVLTYYNDRSDDRADSDVKDAMRKLARKYAMVGVERKLYREGLEIDHYKSVSSTRVRRNGQVIKNNMFDKDFAPRLVDVVVGKSRKTMLDTHISWFGYSDYQPQRNKRNLGGKVLHYHIYPDYDRHVSLEEAEECLNSIWYFGDVYIREYHDGDGSIPYGRFKHENYIDDIACRRTNQGIDKLCCKKGATCRYKNEDDKPSDMWMRRHNN